MTEKGVDVFDGHVDEVTLVERSQWGADRHDTRHWSNRALQRFDARHCHARRPQKVGGPEVCTEDERYETDRIVTGRFFRGDTCFDCDYWVSGGDWYAEVYAFLKTR
jgi:hypothetical protein